MYDSSFYKSALNAKSWQTMIGSMIAKKYNIHSVIDLGCGIGAYLDGFESYGSIVKGIEFSYDSALPFIPDKIKNEISFGDMSKPLNIYDYTFDLSISIEVAEHIDEDKSEIFVSNLTKYSNKYILFSAAPPRGRVVGEGHVNEQPKEYWIEKIEANGFKYSKKDTLEIQEEINNMHVRSRYLSFLKFELMWFIKDTK